MKNHITASKRKNRRPRGHAVDSGFGAKNNRNGTRKNYANQRHSFEAINGKSYFA